MAEAPYIVPQDDRLVDYKSLGRYHRNLLAFINQTGGFTDGSPVAVVTQEVYDSLSNEEKMSGIVFIVVDENDSIISGPGGTEIPESNVASDEDIDSIFDEKSEPGS